MTQHRNTVPPGWLIALALLAVYLIWGSTYLGMRIAVQTIPPFLMAGVRFTIAGWFLFIVMKVRQAPWPSALEWRSAAIVGTFLFTLGNGIVSYCQQYVASSLSAVLLASTPLIATLIAMTWGERPRPLEWLGLCTGFLGVAYLTSQGNFVADSKLAVLMFIAPIAWSVGSVLSLKLPMPKGPMAPACQMIAGGAGMLLVSIVRKEGLPTHISQASIIAFWYLVLVGSLVGFTAYMFLLHWTPPSLATSYAYVNPVLVQRKRDSKNFV